VDSRIDQAGLRCGSVYAVLYICDKTVAVLMLYCYRLDSLTLRRFIITEALELDKLSSLKFLHIDEAVTGPSVSVCLCYLSVHQFVIILFCLYIDICITRVTFKYFASVGRVAGRASGL